jgi:hypothetical protein
MTATIETLHKELKELKKDVTYIKEVLSEDFELSEHPKKNFERSAQNT